MTERHNFFNRPILSEQVNFPVCLAPMVGLSHLPLRNVVRRYLPEGAKTIWPTEMLSTWRLGREAVGATPETLKGIDETPLVPQILGNEEEPIRESVSRLEAWGASGIDINMGCPVEKALKHNYGVALMGDANYAARVVEMTVRHARVPVSVKLRAGLQNDMSYLKKFVKGLENAGASWITLHPRVASQKRRGSADWSQVREVREHLNIPVIGNGDVQCVDDVFGLHELSQCDAVMVGRALAARPWLIWQVGERLGFGPPKVRVGDSAPASEYEEGKEFGCAMLALLEEMEAVYSPQDGLRRLRFHLRMTSGWLEFGHYLYASTSKAKTYEEFRVSIQKFFTQPQKMYLRTALRE